MVHLLNWDRTQIPTLETLETLETLPRSSWNPVGEHQPARTFWVSMWPDMQVWGRQMRSGGGEGDGPGELVTIDREE